MSRVTCPQCRFTVVDPGSPGTSLGACPRCLSRGRGAVPMVEVVRGMSGRRVNGRFTPASAQTGRRAPLTPR